MTLREAPIAESLTDEEANRIMLALKEGSMCGLWSSITDRMILLAGAKWYADRDTTRLIVKALADRERRPAALSEAAISDAYLEGSSAGREQSSFFDNPYNQKASEWAHGFWDARK